MTKIRISAHKSPIVTGRFERRNQMKESALCVVMEKEMKYII